jgi:hypothetical protein
MLPTAAPVSSASTTGGGLRPACASLHVNFDNHSHSFFPGADVAHGTLAAVATIACRFEVVIVVIRSVMFAVCSIKLGLLTVRLVMLIGWSALGIRLAISPAPSPTATTATAAPATTFLIGILTVVVAGCGAALLIDHVGGFVFKPVVAFRFVQMGLVEIPRGFLSVAPLISHIAAISSLPTSTTSPSSSARTFLIAAPTIFGAFARRFPRLIGIDIQRFFRRFVDVSYFIPLLPTIR